MSTEKFREGGRGSRSLEWMTKRTEGGHHDGIWVRYLELSEMVSFESELIQVLHAVLAKRGSGSCLWNLKEREVGELGIGFARANKCQCSG